MGPPGGLGDGEAAGGQRPRARPSLHGCAGDTEGWSHRRELVQEIALCLGPGGDSHCPIIREGVWQEGLCRQKAQCEEDKGLFGTWQCGWIIKYVEGSEGKREPGWAGLALWDSRSHQR